MAQIKIIGEIGVLIQTKKWGFKFPFQKIYFFNQTLMDICLGKSYLFFLKDKQIILTGYPQNVDQSLLLESLLVQDAVILRKYSFTRDGWRSFCGFFVEKTFETTLLGPATCIWDERRIGNLLTE